MYKDWIISRLPSDIPAAVIDYVTRQIDANFGGYISGLQFWAFGERGPDKLLYEAKGGDDLKLSENPGWNMNCGCCALFSQRLNGFRGLNTMRTA